MGDRNGPVLRMAFLDRRDVFDCERVFDIDA